MESWDIGELISDHFMHHYGESEMLCYFLAEWISRQDDPEGMLDCVALRIRTMMEIIEEIQSEEEI